LVTSHRSKTGRFSFGLIGLLGTCGLALAAGDNPGASPAAKPETLAKKLDYPEGIAVDQRNIYWVDSGIGDWELRKYHNGTVRTARKDGKGKRVLARKQRNPNSIVLDEKYVYWTNFGSAVSGWTDGAVMKMAKSGGRAKVVLAPVTSPTRLTQDSDNLYVTTVGDVSTDQVVLAIPKRGGRPRRMVADEDGIACMAVDSTHVYWISQASDNPIFGKNWVLKRAPKAGGAMAVVAGPAAGAVQDLVMDNQTVFLLVGFEEEKDDKLVRVPKQGGPVVTLTAMLEISGGMTARIGLDGDQLCWWFRFPDSDGGDEDGPQPAIRCIAKTGGAPRLVTSNTIDHSVNPVQVMADEQYFYFINESDTLMRIRK
jgi:hypothetical protein